MLETMCWPICFMKSSLDIVPGAKVDLLLHLRRPVSHSSSEVSEPDAGSEIPRVFGTVRSVDAHALKSGACCSFF